VRAPELGGALRVSLKKSAVLWLRMAKESANPTMSDIERNRRWLFGLQERNAPLFEEAKGASYWTSAAQRDEFLRQALKDVDWLTYDLPGDAPVRTVDWPAERHARVEAAFQAWQVKNREWLETREAAKLEPFTDPDGSDALPLP
jgi:hypothetical protein